MELFHTDTDYSTIILGVFLLDHIAHVGVSPTIGYDTIRYDDQDLTCTWKL